MRYTEEIPLTDILFRILPAIPHLAAIPNLFINIPYICLILWNNNLINFKFKDFYILHANVFFLRCFTVWLTIMPS